MRPPIKDSERLPRALELELQRAAKPGRGADAVAWMTKARRAEAEGRREAAYRAACRVKEMAPRSSSVRRVIGVAAWHTDRWHEASQELLAYRRFTGDCSFDPAIAECYRRLGRPERARDFLAPLKPEDVSAPVWADAQVVRARSFADVGRAEVGRDLLESALRAARSPAARDRLRGGLESLAAAPQ
ncbi:MAG: hypothetical protein WDA27_00475 [Actinomycetota bacterium]